MSGDVDLTTQAGAVARRSALLLTLGVAAGGAAAIHLAALPSIWRASPLYGMVLATLGAAQVVTVVAAVGRPVRRLLLLAAAVALAVVVLWVLVRVAHVLPGPDPWVQVGAVIGFVAYLCVALELVAVIGLGALAARRPRAPRSTPVRVLTALAVLPLALVVLIGVAVGVEGVTNGFAGPGRQPDRLTAAGLPAGRMSTVEYCRPDGIPLAMDVYAPAAASGGPAPVVLYVHGGGMGLGTRRTDGLGASLANHADALFGPLQRKLTARGFVVASIDYRLLPAAPWPAPIEDTKCAVRFLRAHAGDMDADPRRIAVWGASGGAQLASLAALAGPEQGFDQGQYATQSSGVQAVVDMFGGSDITDVSDSEPFVRFLAAAEFGTSAADRRSASPAHYVTSDAPPFLILHGVDDPMMPLRHSVELARLLREAGVEVTFVEVHGTGHTLATPAQRPPPSELTAKVVEFLTRTLG